MSAGGTSLELRAARHAALGDQTRLQIVDLLALGDRSPGELLSALGIASNLLGHHLGALERVGLISRHRSEGDRRRSYVRLVPEALDASAASAAGERIRAPRVVFVCTGNSSRSPLAVALWREESPVPADSAGTHPAAATSTGATATAARHGLTLPARKPTSISEVLRPGDFVVTVCDRAHEELGGAGATLHWSVPNPGRVGTAQAYDAAFDELRRRVRALAPRLSAG